LTDLLFAYALATVSYMGRRIKLLILSQETCRFCSTI